MSPVGGDGWRPPRAGTLIGAGAAMLALGALFRLLPWLDLWVSDLFHVTGQGFVLRDGWLPVLLYRAVNWLQIVAVAALVLIGAVWLWRRSPPFGLNPRATLLFAGTLAIGSGLLVNAVFKDQWGRARPAQIERYGGPLAFTPPALMADQCERNCSFTAGHPALIFAGFGFALGLAGARRRRAVIAVAAVGGVVGLGRVVQGGHFLSDVLFSGLICFAVAAALAMLLPGAMARWPGRAKFGAAEAAALRSGAAALAKTGGDALAA
ncbi:MAG: phosphatase PAP2 family protein, partial [Bauldia litoralis]